MESNPIRQAALEAVERMKATWPGARWTVIGEHEYEQALMESGDPELIDKAVTAAIRSTESRYPPPVGELVSVLRTLEERKLFERAKSGASWNRSIDEDALRDAIAALDYAVNDPAYHAEIEEQIRSIRSRLPDKGASVDAEQGPKYRLADPLHRDPPGTLRFRLHWPERKERHDADEL